MLPNGIEDFVKNVPEKYHKEFPDLKSELTELTSDLSEAEDACDAGRIADDAVGELFKTEYYTGENEN